MGSNLKKKKVNSLKKGQRGERKLVKLFSDWWGSEFFRTPGSGAFATLGFKYKDHDLSGDILTLDKTFPFCVESKHVEGWTLEQMLTSEKTLMHKWWKQTVKETPEGKIPLLVFTKNRAPLYCILRTCDWEAFEESHFIGWMPTDTTAYESVYIFTLDNLFKSNKNIWTETNIPPFKFDCSIPDESYDKQFKEYKETYGLK